ncbi:YqzM family protein [Cohnella thermotolerans]|jgi:hypothetical protein|nr:YqzM family protein [Cohnella thermotolerans]
MENVIQDPRKHINEEPRDDLHDLVVGFGGMSAFMFIVFLIAVIVKYVIS